ncbi:aspartyl-phosphate phosphatase Spo0E family protein [Bacillus tropicus]|uniref:Spo0E family sporulation regulatory protein-aspartic acid phosphatase n=1 Tax=Bacillus tropicus TaxID=2026188 RepID=UPI003D1E1C59
MFPLVSQFVLKDQSFATHLLISSFCSPFSHEIFYTYCYHFHFYRHSVYFIAYFILFRRFSITTSCISYLQKKIKKEQQTLQKLVKLYVFTHPLVLTYSQELDQLVVLMMRYLSSS